MAEFKPDPIYEFPPFFTKQPNEDTWIAQLAQWHSIIQSYCEAQGVWHVSPTASIFSNPRIQRQLNPEVSRQVLEDMCKKGSAIALNSSEYYVYFKKPAELALQLKKWADATGHGGSVLTFYELTEGELPGLKDFKNLDPFLLKKVVQNMVKKGEAAALKENGEMVGIKLAA